MSRSKITKTKSKTEIKNKHKLKLIEIAKKKKSYGNPSILNTQLILYISDETQFKERRKKSNKIKN